LKEESILGLRELDRLQDLLTDLRQRYHHPNRRLYFDDTVVVLLVAFFNPVVRSLRGIEDASQMPGINQHLDIQTIRRSTLSDNLEIFDPQLLEPLVASLRRRLNDHQLDQQHPDLRALVNRLRVFDGSYFRLPADVHWAIHQRHGPNGRVRGKVRLNLHMAARNGLPTGMSLSGQGDASEPEALLQGVEPGDILVADRGCFSHDAVHELLKSKADFVLRLQGSVICTVQSERPLTPSDHEQGVLSDQVVLLTGSKNTHEPVPLRLVTVKPDPAGSSRDGRDSQPPAPIRLLTSINDNTAPWVIAAIYRRRWDIELFFRWLKTCANWEHLLSESKNGILIQFYIALIGTLLLASFSGNRPDRYSFNLMCLVMAGQGTLADALPIYEKRRREREMAAASQRRRNAAKKKA
jgi:hypothetical protein